MSKRPQSTPSKDKDAEKHHKGEKADDDVTLKDLGKMMTTITTDMSSMKEDLAAIKGNMVTKDELEEFKEKQVEFIKDNVKAEVQNHMQELKTRNNAFQEFIHQKMIEDVKCKAKLDGFSPAWTEETIKSDPSIAELTRNCAHVEVFRNKKGEGLGKAILTFASVSDRQNAVNKSREMKIPGIFLNNAETELDLKKNKQLKAAFGEVRKQWEGEKKEVKLFKKEGHIKVHGTTVAERDDNTWEVQWKVPQGKLKNEAGLKEALNTMQ